MTSTNTNTNTMWLATVISVLFFAEAAWLIAKPEADGLIKASAYFNATNFILLGLLGLGCLYWPRRKEEEDGKSPKSPASAELVVVVVESTPAADGKSTSDSAKDAPTEAPPKRQVIYLSNLKTFLTFIVVTFHVVCIFSSAAATGLQTYSFDPEKFLVGGGPIRSFTLPSQIFFNMNQFYFMAPFYLISAYFCPRSLDRKGFRKFVVDKLVRLGGAWLLWTMLLGPLMSLIDMAYAGQPLSWAYDRGPTWFVLWLLNFSVVYAAIAQFIPTVKMSMPHPFILLVIGMALSGVYYGISNIPVPTLIIAYFGNMNGWNNAIAMYIPWFIAGIVGSRNDWLKSVEEMSTWVVWTLRFIVVGFWTIIFMVLAQYTIPIPGSHLDFELVFDLLPPVYAMPMTLVVLQLFHQYFNASPQSKLMRNAGSAAYLVYVIQFWPMNLVMMTFVEILKAAGTPIIFINGHNFITTDAEGNGTLLSEGAIWGGFFFVLVLTQLILWPLSFYLRKLPVMNKMF